MESIGKELKLRRLTLELTLEDVAKKIGVTANYISLIERNKNVPNNDIVDKLADLYGIDRDYIYEAYGKIPAPILLELEDTVLRKVLTEIGNDHRLTVDDKKNLYERLQYWHQKIIKEKE